MYLIFTVAVYSQADYFTEIWNVKYILYQPYEAWWNANIF